MIWMILILTSIVILSIWLSQILKAELQQREIKIKRLEAHLKYLENNQSDDSAYDKFIKLFGNPPYIPDTDLSRFRCHERIFNICQNNQDRLKAWTALGLVIGKFSILSNSSSEPSNRAKIIELLFSGLERESFNLAIKEKILQMFGSIENLVGKERIRICTAILNLLKSNPYNESVQSFVTRASRTYPKIIDKARLYSTALEILEENPSSQASKIFALEMGRYYYSSLRGDKRLTIYDEQAIQNDINARSQ